jgi:uncharacterized lipoprotein YmbA
MRRPLPFPALCALAAALAGCATPRSAFYTLSPSAAAAPAPSACSVYVGPVSLPEIVDRPQIVVRTGPNQVFFDEFNRWGSPLRYEIARVVAEDLGSLLGTPMVAASPRPPDGDAAYRVAVDVIAFESSPGEAAVLDAAWTVRSARDGAVRSGRTAVREATGDGGYPALAAAHSRALGAVSAAIADAVRAMEGAATPRSPAPGSGGTGR